ncbi:MAG: selenocysteine-specific translation elongation factor [Desulfuromonadales bacterium]|nr:selenocysteine-specific translation elongation factor [Desulfuromonadales bacterium]
MAEPRFHIIGTAGHVDHGKTALIGRLTGIDTDRLREEKERGISIDLGFAPLHLPDGTVAGVVDVPGHERFIHNMLAGIGGIDLVLLVVDVNEGVMPQTREHLQILKLLKIPRGILVLTKCDLAEADWLDIVEEEIREEVAGTFLAEAPACRVSSVTGAGIPELIATIQKILVELPPRDEDGPARLPIDRHFTISGFGTVVTGTLLSGRIKVGDLVEVIPPGETVRVRELQVHGRKAEEARAGQRVAVNLAGFERADLERGAVVATPGFFELTSRVDARLTLLKEAPRSLRFRDPVHLHLGTARVTAKVILLDRDKLEPGESVLTQIQFDQPLVAHRQDRFIVRSYSPMTTIGGGQIIDPAPPRHRRFRPEVMTILGELESGERAFLLQKLAELVCARGKDLELTSGLGRERVAGHLDALAAAGQARRLGDQWLTEATAQHWERLLLDAVDGCHRDHPLLPGIPHATLKGVLPAKVAPKAFEELLTGMVAAGTFEQSGEHVARPGFVPRPSGEQQRLIDQITELYRRAGTQANNRNEMLGALPAPAETVETSLAFLFSRGELVRLSDEMIFHRDAYTVALTALREHFNSKPTLTLGEFRDHIGSARKQTQALLEHFDALKYTMRRGDERVAWQLPKG